RDHVRRSGRRHPPRQQGPRQHGDHLAAEAAGQPLNNAIPSERHPVLIRLIHKGLSEGVGKLKHHCLPLPGRRCEAVGVAAESFPPGGAAAPAPPATSSLSASVTAPDSAGGASEGRPSLPPLPGGFGRQTTHPYSVGKFIGGREPAESTP